MNIIEQKINKYVDVLASNSSMPGGGTVSALNGAEGTALILMVCNLTLGKEKYKKYEKLVDETIEKCEQLKNKFLYLAEKDILTFHFIENVFKMPNKTEKQKAKRKKEMEKACIKCCEVPYDTIIYSLMAINCIKELIGKSNKSAESDLGVAAVNILSAAEGAYFNIVINLKYITDKKIIKKYNDIENNELKEIQKIKKEIFKKVIKSIKNKKEA